MASAGRHLPAGASIPTPAHQTFYFDARGLLRRHDYVAEVVGGWAKAAHYCDDHAQAGGLVFPTRRWVRPIRPGNRSLPFPTLVWLELSDLQVERLGWPERRSNAWAVEATPVLWHIEISHYNEKARWALDYKGVEHERRAPTPGPTWPWRCG